MSVRCGICLQPVSTRADKIDNSVPNDDGGRDHRRCAERDERLSEKEHLMLDILGDPRRKAREHAASQIMAQAAGHEVSRTKVDGQGTILNCSCGWTTNRPLLGADVSRAALEHRKDAAVYAPLDELPKMSGNATPSHG